MFIVLVRLMCVILRSTSVSYFEYFSTSYTSRSTSCVILLTLSTLVRVLLFSVFYMIFLNIFEAQKKRGEASLSVIVLFIYYLFLRSISFFNDSSIFSIKSSFGRKEPTKSNVFLFTPPSFSSL